MDESIVVSDKGEQWSPNTPPATTAYTAATSVVSSPPHMVKARGNVMGMQMANVPQEAPVAKAMKFDTTAIRTACKHGILFLGF